MKLTYYQITLFLLAFGSQTVPLFTPGLQAQTMNRPLVKSRFQAMVWSGIARDLFYLKEGKPVTFTATSSNPSKWIDYHGPVPLVFYKKGETMLNSEGQRVPRPVASFSPKSNKDHLLMFSLEKNEPELRYTIFGFEEDQGIIQEGFRIINFTHSDIAILLNDDMQVLPTGTSRHLKPIARSDNSVQATIAFSSQDNDEWEVKYKNIFRGKPGLRLTLFVTMPNGNINIRRFRDRVPAGSE